MTRAPDDDAVERVRIEKTAVFLRSFVVPGVEEVLPAGEYQVEAELRGPGDPDGWEAQVLVHLHPTPGSPALTRSLTLPLAELDRAIARDKVSGRPLADLVLEEMLHDPMVRLFMASDRISEDDMRRVHARWNADPDGESE
jgi:hypothetical protein